jgi:hypothetical protein
MIKVSKVASSRMMRLKSTRKLLRMEFQWIRVIKEKYSVRMERLE